MFLIDEMLPNQLILIWLIKSEALYKQKVPSRFKLSTGWLTDKSKNPDSQLRLTSYGQINEATISLGDLEHYTSILTKMHWWK